MPRLLPVLRLLRAGTLFSPAADVLASWSVAGLPWTMAFPRAGIAAVALYAAGMVWNDVADRRLDAVVRPERPVPSGDVSLPFAIGLGTLLLAIGIAVSPCRAFHGALASLVLGYDFVGKRVVWLGAPWMGLLRGLNLATALAAGDPGAADPARQALLVAAVAYGLYIACITCLGELEDHPHPPRRYVLGLQVVAVTAVVAGAVTGSGNPWFAALLLLAPVAWFASRTLRQREWDRAAIRGAMTRLLLGTMVYTAVLAAASAAPLVALAIGAAVFPARWIARRIALT